MTAFDAGQMIAPELVTAFTNGFALSLGLILAIGAQNAFVLRQGLMRRHVFAVALFCAVSDALLIAAGVGGAAVFISGFAATHSAWLFGLAALWLSVYGFMRARDAVLGVSGLSSATKSEASFLATMGTAALLTYGNPHVYLDTVVLLGTISVQYHGLQKLVFGFGAALASLIFFFVLAYGAALIAPAMARPQAWRVLDAIIAVIMFGLAASMARAGGLI